jgi:diguanylate cyclase (GGDEF)-like protein
MNWAASGVAAPEEGPALRVVQGRHLRLDLLEQSIARVETLLATTPDTTDPASARIWLEDAEALLTVAGDFDRARLLRACAAVRDQLGEVARAATGYTAAAIAALRSDEVSEALELAVRGLVAFESLPQDVQDPLAESRMAYALGELCCEFFDYERALRFAEIAVGELTPSGQPRRWTAAAHLLAEVALIRARELASGERWAALLDRAEHVARRLMMNGEPQSVAAVTGPRVLAEVLCERGHPTDAWSLLELAASAAGGYHLTGRASPRRELAALQLGRGRCLHQLGRPEAALTELDGALEALDAERDLADHIQALRLRSLVLEQAGDTAGALADMRALAEQVWVRHQRQIGGFMDQVWGRAGAEGRRRDLEAREQDLIRTAEQDPLTGLENRRGVERFCAAMAPSDPVCLVMIDIDHFKAVNDRFGHPVGDSALREVATVLSASVRSVDRVARWGGEEFLIALPAASGELGAEAASRVRRRVEEHDWRRIVEDLSLTLSAGVACGPAGEMAAVLRRADGALYAAKRAGRNRVVTG